IQPERSRRRDDQRSSGDKGHHKGDESQRHRAWDSGNSEANRRDHALEQRSSENAVDDRANCRAGEIEQTIASLPGYPMERGMQLVRRGMSVAIEKERDQQAQSDLKDTFGKCLA